MLHRRIAEIQQFQALHENFDLVNSLRLCLEVAMWKTVLCFACKFGSGQKFRAFHELDGL